MADTFDSVVANVKHLTRRQIAEVAIAENARIMEDRPRPLGVKRHVDGVEGAPETAVQAGGVIVYDYNRLDQIAEFALDTLRQLSPVREGNYVRSHVLMLEGRVVDNLDGYQTGMRVTISNSEPYTRKIEIGQKGYRAHGHVYEKATAVVNRRFGNSVRARFLYEAAPPGAIHDWAESSQMSHGRHIAKNASHADRVEWLTRQPTMLIEELR